MRVPSYRKHSSGQARVTLNGKDHLLGTYGSPESKEAYGRVIQEFVAAKKRASFGKDASDLLIQDVLLDYLRYAEDYYRSSTEYANLKLTARPLFVLYGSLRAHEFGPAEFKAVRQWWMDDASRSRQYINKLMKRTIRIIKWAVSEGMMPSSCHEAVKCVEPLRRGKSGIREAKRITCVSQELVDRTLPHLTPVLSDMVKFQLFTGCRPGEVCKLTPAMVKSKTNEVWEVHLEDHKTAYRGKQRVIYLGRQAQNLLKPYLHRQANEACFSPRESEQQRQSKRHAARVTPKSCGNVPGSNVARKPRKKPGKFWTTGTYGRAIRNACNRANLPCWSPNQLRHNVATALRKDFGLEAASVILGHSEVGVTQVYAEQDRNKAIEIARKIG